MSRDGLTSDERKNWLEYDQSHIDFMDNAIIEDFKDSENDVVPQSTGVSWGASFEFMRVGNGVQTDSKCGTFRHSIACLDVEKHDLVTIDDGVNHKGKIPIKKVYYSCDKPSCPICFKKGYSVREAGHIESILTKASQGYVDKLGVKHQALGLIEHAPCSIPSTDYGLTFERLKAKAIKAYRARGMIGGVLIFHAERFAKPDEARAKGVPEGWRYAPHWHCLGFLDAGYSRCRHCKNCYMGFRGEMHVKETAKCLACSGWEGWTRRQYLKEGGHFGAGNSGSGYIVKVMGERKTVFGTAWYQLNHATLVKGHHDRVVAWWGVCSYTKLKLKKEDRIKRDLCPLCGNEMIPVKYVGLGEPEGDCWDSKYETPYFDSEGRPNWIAVALNKGNKYAK